MEEFTKSTNEQTKMEIEEISQDSINFKLSLCKKKFKKGFFLQNLKIPLGLLNYFYQI